MITFHDKLAALRTLPPLAAAGFVQSAWTCSQQDEYPALLRALLAIDCEAAHAFAIQHLHYVNAETATILARNAIGPIQGGLRRAIEDRDVATAANAILSIRARLDVELVDVLAELLEGSNAVELRAQSAAALLEVVIGRLGRHGRRSLNSAARTLLDRSLVAAATSYDDHRRPEIILALAIALRRAGPELRAWSKNRDTAARLALTRITRNFDISIVRGNLLRWLTDETLGPAAARCCSGGLDAAARDDFLRAAHVLRLPAYRRAVRGIDRPLKVLPATRASAPLQGRAARAIPSVIASLGLRKRTRIDLLNEAIGWTDPAARMAALRTLIGLEPAHELEAIVGFAQDSNPHIARVAATHCIAAPRMRSALEANGHRILRSPHESVRSMVRPASCASAAELLRENLLSIPRHECRAAARALAARDRAAFIRLARTVLSSGSTDEQSVMIDLISRQKLEREVELELLTVAASRDARLAATAVTMLGRIDTHSATQALTVALRHQNPRVRANAIETIAVTLEDSHRDVLIEPHLDNSHARIRANAFLAWLRTHPDDFGRFAAMIEDERPEHRRSAAWVVSRLRNPVRANERQAALNDRLRNLKKEPSA